MLSEDHSHRRSIQATRLAVGGAGRSMWRYAVGVHAIPPAFRGAQTARTSRSASRAPRPVSAPVGARRCLPRGAGSRWVAAEPRPRRRRTRRILALPTDPRAVVPVESRARRPELPRRRLVLAPRGGSGSAARAWLRLDLVGGLAPLTPTHPVVVPPLPAPCAPTPSGCLPLSSRCCPPAPSPPIRRWLSSPPAPLAVSGRRSPAWLRLVACRAPPRAPVSPPSCPPHPRPPHPTACPCRPAAARRLPAPSWSPPPLPLPPDAAQVPAPRRPAVHPCRHSDARRLPLPLR